jgi:hypothetical protein
MELSKHTPKEHSDYVYLRQALQTITNIVNEINETKRFQENQAKLMQIQQSFVQTTWGGVCDSIHRFLHKLLFISMSHHSQITKKQSLIL